MQSLEADEELLTARKIDSKSCLLNRMLSLLDFENFIWGHFEDNKISEGE